MRIVEAQPADSDRLKAFFENSTVPGRITFKQKRHTDFFDFYKIQANAYKTYILEDKHKELHGCATLIFREGYLNGQKEMIGFAKDLRFSKNRHALTEWPQRFAPILSQEMESNNCRAFFTAISEKERESYGAFIRPKAFRGNLPRYYMLRKFRLISIHGRVPFFSKPLHTIHLDYGKEENASELATYLNRKAVERPLAPIYNEESFRKQISSWPQMNLENFIIARDYQGRIIGCCAPWSPNELQSLIVENYGPLTGSAQTLLNIGSKFGITRPLARPGKPLNICYLTHLFADNPDIFYSLLDRAWSISAKNHTLVYPHFSGFYQTLPHPTFIHSRTSYAVYTLLPPQNSLPDFLRPRLQSPPPFLELPLI